MCSGVPLVQRFFPLPWLALSSAGVIVKLLHWSSWRCRSRSQLCSLLGSPDSCRDESCYPHPKGLGCENQENPRCHSAVQLCVGSARGTHRGGPGGTKAAPVGSSHLCMGNRTQAPPGSGVEKVEVERMKMEVVSAWHTSVQRVSRLRVVPLSVLPPSLPVLP